MKHATCWQINLQTHLGGGEVYAAFLCRALDRLGITTTLCCHSEAHFWDKLNLPQSTTLLPISDIAQLADKLPSERVWLLNHGTLAAALAQRLAAHHLLTAIAHMPPQGRSGDRYQHFHQVFGVSGYVLEGLRAIEVPAWPTPLYGVADLDRGASADVIVQTSCYDWDKRKGRDRLLGLVEPWLEPFRSRPQFVRRPGITLGVVSRLTPIKQFPQLFDIISRHIAARPNFNLEVFGAGGYASVRDLREATRPLGDRVRFWGQQRNVGAVYRQLDYLMSGLPEKEALGLNIIEAQGCDTPVIAVNALPFTETIIDGSTGFLYRDPREDNGAAFAALLDRIADPTLCLHPVQATEHLAKFSLDAFVARLAPVVDTMQQRL